MKQYIKNIMILILALPWGLLLTNCSDSKSDYSDDNAYPPPTVELTSPSEIDVVEYNSTVTVSARSFSAVGIHSIYATLLKMDENGEYEEINATERQRLKIDTLQTDMTLEFDLNVKVNTREAAGILVTSTDVLTKTAQKVIPIKKITKLPSQIFTEPSDFPVLVPDEEVSLSVVIRSAVGIKSVKHTLCNKVLGDLKDYTSIPVSGNPLEMEFILKTVVDNKETNGIKIVVEDIEGLKEEKIINVEGLEGVDNNVALVFNDIEMAPEWEHSTEPDQPYIFSIEGIMVQGVQKHVLSLKEIKGYGSKANSVDFAFINIWRNPSFVAVKNRGFSYVSASRINGGPIGRAYDVNDWIKPAGVTTSKTGFALIPDDKVTDLGIDVMMENAASDVNTFEALNVLQSIVKSIAEGGADMLMQRVNASDGYPNDPCSLQIKDGSYIAFVTAAGKYGVIHVIEAANDMDALVAGGCKIATPTGVVGSQGPAYSGAGITGLTYDGVALLYGRTCKLKIVVQK